MTDVYRWRGDTFDADCMIVVLGEHEPYSDWYSVPKSYDVETQLDEIAEHYGVDRDDEEKMLAADFPIPVPVPPLPSGFCSYCLRWFSETPAEHEEHNPHE